MDVAVAVEEIITAAQHLPTTGESADTASAIVTAKVEKVETEETPANNTADDAALVDAAPLEATPANSATDVISTPLSTEEQARNTVQTLVRTYIARSVQGSSDTLQEVVETAGAGLLAMLMRLKALPSSADVAEGALDTVLLVTSIVEKLADPVVLAEEIKVLAARQTYGTRSDKSAMFDCTDALAVWRWEVHSMQYFTKTSQNTLREVRSIRGRYSRTLRAIQRVLEQLHKQPFSETKLAPLEERSAKCIAEVEKAKEKRRELEVKRAADIAEKKRKDEIKEQKRLEKEESDRLKKEAAATLKTEEKEKKTPFVSEKAMKKAAEIEKSKNVFMNFLKSSSTSTAAKTTETSTSSTLNNTTTNAVTTEVNTGVVVSTTSIDVAPICTVESDEDKLERFEAAMRSEMSMGEIMRAQRERNEARLLRRNNNKKTQNTKKRPRYIDLHVAVIVPDPRARSAFDAGDNTYSEIQEKRFNNKMRMLSFWEDHRPAYLGTVSRNSRVICGRRPLARDTELLNYEYDSEEDWEEEVEGEDLNETDEEEEAGGNELEYDDFFCRDDDYGSDAEEDMDGGAVKMSHRNTIEVFGPRFINPTALPPIMVVPRDPREEGDTDTAASVGRSAEKISSFTIFDLSTGELVAQPSKGDADTNNLAAYTAVCYTHYPTPTLGTFDIPTTTTNTSKNNTTTAVSSGNDETVDKAAPGPAKCFDEAKMPELARFVHGKKEGIDKLVLAFHALYPKFSKLQIQKRIKEITNKAKHSEGYGTSRFLVKPEILEKLQISVRN